VTFQTGERSAANVRPGIVGAGGQYELRNHAERTFPRERLFLSAERTSRKPSFTMVRPRARFRRQQRQVQNDGLSRGERRVTVVWICQTSPSSIWRSTSATVCTVCWSYWTGRGRFLFAHEDHLRFRHAVGLHPGDVPIGCVTFTLRGLSRKLHSHSVRLPANLRHAPGGLRPRPAPTDNRHRAATRLGLSIHQHGAGDHAGRWPGIGTAVRSAA